MSYFSASANTVLGYNEKELMDKSWYDYIHTCDVDIVKNCHRLSKLFFVVS